MPFLISHLCGLILLPESCSLSFTTRVTGFIFWNPVRPGSSFFLHLTAYYKRHLCRLDPWPDCLQRTFDGMGLPVYLAMWGPSEFTCNGTLQSADLTPRLQEVQVPVLFTCGRHDEARPATVARFCELAPDASLVIMEDASHMHHLEQPDRFLAAVRGFLGA